MDSLQDLSTPNKIDYEVILSSLPPTPSKSTAFTIEFDDLNNNLLKNGQKKNFERGDSLKDSLRKHAPKKLEKLTKLKTKNEDTDIETKDNFSLENDKKLNDNASFLIQKMFSSQSISKPANCKNKLVNKTNLNLDSTTRLSSSCKSSPLKLKNFNYNFNSKSATKSNEPFQNANPNVICTDENENQSLLPPFLKCENTIDNVSDDEDALSETGTYTVELDNQDPIAEEARKRINDIFGVNESKYKQQIDSMSSTSTNSTSKGNSKHSFKISSIEKIYNNQENNNQINRTRHSSERESTPLKRTNEVQRKNSTSSTERLLSSFRNRRSSALQQEQQSNLKRQNSFGKSSVSKLSTNKTPINLNKKKSQLNQNINLINQNNTFVFNCNSKNSATNDSLLNRARANSITKNLTKKVANKNSSFLKDNDENGSIKSEASTVGSTSLSSVNSDKCKSETGQASSNLRFNRAFALRRARLGIDTPPSLTAKQQNSTTKISTKPNNLISHIPINIATNNQSRSSSQCSVPIEYFDRSDGGRYSLRAASSKPPIGKLVTANKSKLTNHYDQRTNLDHNQLIKHESSSSLINAISATKNKMANKMITKKNSFIIENGNDLKSNSHVRANSFAGSQFNDATINLLKPRLSSATSNSSNNGTMSNASTSEDLSNASDQINVKSLQHLSPFQLGRRIYSTKPHYMAQTNSFRSKLEENNLYQNSSSNSELVSNINEKSSPIISHQLQSTESERKIFGQLNNNCNLNNGLNNYSNGKSLSALDYLVLSAVHQLSFKLRCKLRSILDAEKSKYPIDNENRILIEELLPQVNVTEYRSNETSEKTISRDLSNVLKNLKRIEQSLEVINLLLESNSFMNKTDENTGNDDLLCNKDRILTNEDTFSLEI